MTRSLPRLIALCSVLFMFGLSAFSGAAAAKSYSFPAVEERQGVFVFKVRQLAPQTIRRAFVHIGDRRRPVRVSHVRAGARRGVVRIRAPRAAAARSASRRRPNATRRARLTIVINKPAAAGGSCGRPGSFGAGDRPGGCWRPYADSSPFNQRLPERPRVAAHSDAIVKRVLGFGKLQNLEAGTAGSEDDWSAPIYYPRPSDPTFTVQCQMDWGTCEVEGMQVAIPEQARAAAGGDGHIVVVDRASGWEYDLWQVRSKPSGGGVLKISWGGRTRLDGDGLDSNSTAAMFGRIGGIIRAPELQAGEINHALYMVASCDSGEFVYPALKPGRECSSIGASNTNAPPMGSRFQLGMSDKQIAALAVPEWKKTILRAMARYGLYMGDTGSGSWAIQAESGASYTSFGDEDPLVSFARSQNVPTYNGRHVFNMADGVDWQRYLRVVDPCVTNHTC